MNWRSPRVFIPFILAVILVIGGSVFFASRLRSVSPPGAGTSLSAYPTNVVTIPPLPTPGPRRTTYISSRFSYLIRYPTDWPLQTFADGSVKIYYTHDPGAPDAIAIQIECAANPTQLDAQHWWKQHQPPDGSQQVIGTQSLSSGTVAFVALGHGQGNYYLYTLTHNQTACTIVADADLLDLPNDHIITTSVNTFHWQ